MRVILVSLFLITTVAFSHFQMIIPKSDVVTDTKAKSIELRFMHPFENSMMHMEKPNRFGYFLEKKEYSLLDKLQKKSEDKKSYWEAKHSFDEIGDYLFFVDPKPYFEPSEGKFIRHITKTVVDAHNAHEGWDEPIGLKAEIIPLTRPYSLYEGNLFSGVVMYKQKPLPYAEIEVEFYNKEGFKAPTEGHITQVIKADKNGVFHFAMPKSGWWGFAALIDDDVTITKEKKEYPVELGAVFWIYTYKGFYAH